MPAQFIRVEAFSAKEVSRISAEANREEGFCSHVETPKPPKWINGSVKDLKIAVNDYMATRTAITYKGGKKSSRKRRSDHRCLIGGVTSWPVPVKDFFKQDLAAQERFEEWVWASKAWLETRFGENLKAIVAHRDEGFLHLHFFVVGDANQLHPGLAAEFVDGVRLRSRLEKRKRYVAAMQNFLDEAHTAVGCKFNMDRVLARKPVPRIKDRSTYLQIRALREKIEKDAIPEMAGELDKVSEDVEDFPHHGMVF